MGLYSYDGPVMEFDTCVNAHWKAQTCAPTEKKARSNLAFQYKKQTKRSSEAKITIPGKLYLKEGFSTNGRV